MRHPFIAGNWKMFKTVHEAVVYVKEFRSLVKDIEDVEIVVAPTFTAVHACAEAARNTRVGIAAQNLHWEREGAFTGEISGPMIKEAGAEYVIIGHSERRTLFGETDEMVNRKVHAIWKHDMTPILCVGETLEERDAGGTESTVTQQVRRAFDGVEASMARSVVIAYEPIWAIGTGRTAEPGDAGRVVELIRETLATRYDDGLAEGIRVQYGGSVKPGNIREFMAHPEIDGALVGGASLDPEEFALIVKYR
jgi:triosephosphate isomerase